MNKFEEGLINYLSPEQLKKIQSKKIGIGGAGGLGSNVSVILARSGFKNFEIIDFDIIEPSNLNRQYYFLEDVGLVKVETLAKYLSKINPDISVIAHHSKWPNESIDSLFNKCDFIVEAFDRADWKKFFIEYYQDKVKYIISGNGMAGLNEKKPLVLKRINNIYLVGDGSTDTALGHPPLSPRVTACAAMMAEIILDLTLNQ